MVPARITGQVEKRRSQQNATLAAAMSPPQLQVTAATEDDGKHKQEARSVAGSVASDQAQDAHSDAAKTTQFEQQNANPAQHKPGKTHVDTQATAGMDEKPASHLAHTNSMRAAAQRAARLAAAVEEHKAPPTHQPSFDDSKSLPSTQGQPRLDLLSDREAYGRPNFGRMMHEKRESISQLRERGHPVDRRTKFEDGQPARGNRMYDVKEERELLKQAAFEHPKKRAFKPRFPRQAGRPAVAGSQKGRADGGTKVPPKARDEL